MVEKVKVIRESANALFVNPAFVNDVKWQERVKKAMEPLDIEERVRGQVYTAAKKELDTAAMDHYRLNGEIKAVTNEDIEALFQIKWAKYLAKKADKAAKEKAFAKAS